MKMTLAFVLGCTALTGAVAKAASVHVVTTPVEPFVSEIRSIYLDGGADNGMFDSIQFDARAPFPNVRVQLFSAGVTIYDVTVPFSIGDPPQLNGQFANQASGLTAGVPRPAGQPFTYRNRVLDRDPMEPEVPGLGWTILGAFNTPTQLSFVGGPLGQKISTAGQPGGRLFLANLFIQIPEPTTASLAVLTTVALIRTRRCRTSVVASGVRVPVTIGL